MRRRGLIAITALMLAACAAATLDTVTLPTLASETVWVGSDVTPGELKRAAVVLANVSDLGTDPTDGALGACLTTVLGDEDNPPTASACKFEASAVPADVCEPSKCETVGKALCEKKPGHSAKGTTIVADYCITACAPTPVKDNTAAFWVGVECP